MLKKWYLSAFVLLTCLNAVAQNTPIYTPEWELQAGYQFAHNDIGAAQNFADAITVPLGLPSISVGRTMTSNGGEFSFQQNVASWWGGIVDFSGTMANKKVDVSEAAVAAGLVPLGTRVVAGFKPTVYTVTAGPQFAYRKHQRIEPFARLLFGVAHGDLSPDDATAPVLKALAPSFKTTETNFAMMAGVGVDYVLRKYVALRGAWDFQRTYLFDEHQANFRFTAGVNFRFGQRSGGW